MWPKMSVERTARTKLGSRPSSVAGTGSATASVSVNSKRRLNHLKDEVYREMLRLEAEQPGAEMGLALALLRAVVRPQTHAADPVFQQWLGTVCTLGLKMIEDSLHEGARCEGVE